MRINRPPSPLLRYDAEMVRSMSYLVRNHLQAFKVEGGKKKIGLIKEGNWRGKRNGVARKYVTYGIRTEIMTRYNWAYSKCPGDDNAGFGSVDIVVGIGSGSTICESRLWPCVLKTTQVMREAPY